MNDTKNPKKNTDQNSDDNDIKVSEKLEEISKQIWLAGLGAYGRSLDQFQTGYDKLSDESQKLFQELVQRGEALQSDTQAKIKSQSTDMDSRISALKKRLQRSSELDEKLEQVNDKLDALTKSLNKSNKSS